VKPKQFITMGKRTGTSRIIGTYEIDNAELGVTKLDKSQVLYSMYTIQQHIKRDGMKELNTWSIVSGMIL
jgi:hypothetical protein